MSSEVIAGGNFARVVVDNAVGIGIDILPMGKPLLQDDIALDVLAFEIIAAGDAYTERLSDDLRGGNELSLSFAI